MAKKGKELDLGGIRVQVDPFILTRRILTRQKLLLTTVAVLGGAITVGMYKTTPKSYASSANVAIRVDAMDETYVRTLLNRAMRDLNSDGEMMLMINELDLFPSTRVSLPYDIALRRMRNELNINRSTGSIGVSYMSKDPVECQRVVAFATERVLAKIQNLLDSPYKRELEALDSAITELEPKVKEAQTKLYEFKAKHPSIAVTTPDFIPQDSPLAAIESDIKRAERNLKRCYAGAKPVTRPSQLPPVCREASSARRQVDALLQQYTANHPTVISAKQEATNLKRKCETAKADSGSGGPKPGMSQAECVASAKSEIRRLHESKVTIQKKAIKKPKLQRKWAELSVEANQLQSQFTALQERRAKGEEDRKVNAGAFQENFTLVDPARVPQIPSSPDLGKFATMGMAITAIIGLALAALREALRQSFLSSEEFEEQTGLQVLAVLPDISND